MHKQICIFWANLTAFSPEMRGIGGSSSGAIAAFMVAWERPDAFHKVGLALDVNVIPTPPCMFH
jgi:hypothetical protein